MDSRFVSNSDPPKQPEETTKDNTWNIKHPEEPNKDNSRNVNKRNYDTTNQHSNIMEVNTESPDISRFGSCQIEERENHNRFAILGTYVEILQPNFCVCQMRPKSSPWRMQIYFR
ncbi:uncharacterized protein LOC142221486 isoform X2 [Haematobia irritans]|uniref:uncharacterized protein LOC142221486 isoform X2 n=1 Tax=Haematobia irritans TaxID=7368 RepID=UPI003F50523C